MEQSQLKELKKQLAESLGVSLSDSDDDQDDDADKHYANAIKLIYQSSAMQVLKVAARLFKGSSFDGEIPARIHEVPLPKDGPHDFQLGDWVEITVSLNDFKTIQRATLGWNTRLVTVHGHIGVVTEMKSKYNNAITLFFPEVLSSCVLHAGILQKVDRKKYENYKTPWKPGNMVKTIPDSKILMRLQQGLGPIPSRFHGKKGRVISICSKSVEVTFDDTSCHHVNQAGLVQCEDETPIKRQKIEHSRGFKIGDEARIISNMKRLIENQKKAMCEWESEMSMLRGKDVTITSVLSDGTLYVQLPRRGSWKVSPDSVLSPTEDDPLYPDELGFVTEDIVKIKRSNDLRTILTGSKIPFSFLEYLRSPAKIGTIREDFDCYLLFNVEQHIQANPKALRKATKEEARKYWEIQTKAENLTPGDAVHLDVGPPNYVRAVLQEAKVDQIIIKAMTRSAKLVGFLDQHYAVIEYGNNQKFKIKRKYLTVPDKFHITDSREGINLKTIEEIQKVLSKSIANLLIEKGLGSEEWSVDVLTVSYGMPPSVELKVISLIVKPNDVYKWLQKNSGWTIQYLSEGQLLVQGIQGYDGEMKVAIYFNDDGSVILPFTAPSEASSLTETYQDGKVVKVGAGPIHQGDPPRRGPQVEDPRPVLNSFEQFKLLRFNDPSLAQDVYFPYIVHGPRRTPAATTSTQPAEGAQTEPGRVIYNIANVDQINN